MSDISFSQKDVCEKSCMSCRNLGCKLWGRPLAASVLEQPATARVVLGQAVSGPRPTSIYRAFRLVCIIAVDIYHLRN